MLNPKRELTMNEFEAMIRLVEKVGHPTVDVSEQLLAVRQARALALGLPADEPYEGTAVDAMRPAIECIQFNAGRLLGLLKQAKKDADELVKSSGVVPVAKAENGELEVDESVQQVIALAVSLGNFEDAERMRCRGLHAAAVKALEGQGARA